MEKKLIKNINKLTAFSIVPIILFLIIFENRFSVESLSNSLFLVGLVYFLIGLFRYTKRLNFYDLFVFGWKKLLEIITTKRYSKNSSEVGEYYDYLNNKEDKKDFLSFILSGLLLIVISGFLIVF